VPKKVIIKDISEKIEEPDDKLLPDLENEDEEDTFMSNVDLKKSIP
jgi:hypothetical protein